MTQKEYFKKKYNSLWGNETFSEFLKSSKQLSNQKFIRVNTSKISHEEINKWLKNNRVKFNSTNISNCTQIIKSFFNLSGSHHSLLGNIFQQDISSQIPLTCLNWNSLPKNISILDMAASPGAKTTQILDMLEQKQFKYSLTALEPNTKRLTKLINNLQKFKAKNTTVLNQRGEEFSSKNKFDLIILDAPCSGNFIDDNKWFDKRNQKGIESMAHLQKQLITNAIKHLKPKGVLLYSTCSLEIEENEEVIQYALKKHQVKTIAPINYFSFSKPLLKSPTTGKFDSQIQKTFRCLPPTYSPFYVALLTKNS